jgi:hypothetical protein
MSIPASAIAQVLANVISGGGTALDIQGLFLTNGARVPIGQVLPFANAAAVSAYFGPSSTEYAFALTYFGGFDTSTKKPGGLLFAQYPQAAVAGYVRGGSGLTLAQVQAITSGTLTVTADGGASKTTSALNLSTATSFSNAAAMIQAAFTSPGFTVSWDSVAQAFLITSATTGSTSSIAITTGAVATALLLTAATGAVTSPGAAAATPAAFMNTLINTTTNWVGFTTTWNVSDSDGLAFAGWNNAQNKRYLYTPWDTEAAAAAANDTASLGYQIKQAGYGGVALQWQGAVDPVNSNLSALLLGFMASIDFDAVNGRATMAFKTQAGFPATVADATSASNLIANGYNFYGAYATANDQFTFFYPGQVTGPFGWIDSYVNEIWMSNAFQLAIVQGFTTILSAPYNADGYALMKAILSDPIQSALSFGAIRAGVQLSAAQTAEVNATAGANVADTISTRGWYLQIQPASSGTRAARTTPPAYFWWTDGESIQQMTLNSLSIQ